MRLSGPSSRAPNGEQMTVNVAPKSTLTSLGVLFRADWVQRQADRCSRSAESELAALRVLASLAITPALAATTLVMLVMTAP